MGSLAHVAEQKKEIVKELCKLFGKGLSLEVIETQPMIAQFWVRSKLIDDATSLPQLIRIKTRLEG